jgi:hypothetical protein
MLYTQAITIIQGADRDGKIREREREKQGIIPALYISWEPKGRSIGISG